MEVAMAFDVGDLIFKNSEESLEAYIDRVYEIFKSDFINTKPLFHKRVGLKRYPLRNGREATFWHFTTFGEKEDIRDIDIKRCERIKFPKIVIENYNDDDVKYWENERKGCEKRILLYFEKENYLVVLSDRGDFVLPWTAYPITYKNQKDKLLKEYGEYQKKRG